jgi:hypothetical protein
MAKHPGGKKSTRGKKSPARTVPRPVSPKKRPRGTTGKTAGESFWLAHSESAATEGVFEAAGPPRTHLLFIHGIANKPDAETLLRDWMTALADGGGLDLRQPHVTVSMVYWADVLYAEPEREMAQDIQESLVIPPADELQPGWEADLARQEQDFVKSTRARFDAAGVEAQPALVAAETAASKSAFPSPGSSRGR